MGEKVGTCIRGNRLTLLLLLGVSLGIGGGLTLRTLEQKWTPRELAYLKFPGELYLRILQALVLPLTATSLVSAIGSLDFSISKRIGIHGLTFYLITTILSVCTGTGLVLGIGPGRNTGGFGSGMGCSSKKPIYTIDAFLDVIRNIFPPNLVQATIQQSVTIMERPVLKHLTGESEFRVVWRDGVNMMGILMFSILLGGAIGTLNFGTKRHHEAGNLLQFFGTFSKLMIRTTTSVIWLSPIALCFLIMSQLIGVVDILGIFQNMGWFILTFILGIFIHGLLNLPILYWLITGNSPIEFYLKMLPAITTAFGAGNSMATLPVTLSCLEDRNGLDLVPRVTRFLVPIGATINMDGTGLLFPVVAVYIAQLCGLHLNLGTIFTIIFISVATSIGSASVPLGSIVSLFTILGSVGLPVEYLTYIVPIDLLLGRLLTVVNVLGDAVGATVVHHLSREELKGSGSLKSCY